MTLPSAHRPWATFLSAPVLLLAFACGTSEKSPEAQSVAAPGSIPSQPVPHLQPSAALGDGQPDPATNEAVRAPGAVPNGKQAATNVKEAEATSAAAPIDSPPEVKRLVIASQVEDREPKPLLNGRAREPVTAFVELANESKEDAEIIVTFEHESGQKVGFIELAIPPESPRYRTWGRTRNIQKPGKWTAIVSSKSGKELAREDFDVLAEE